jgi:type III secretion protein N (ATPase)
VPELDDIRRAFSGTETFRITGRVRSVVGLSIRATLPGARVGDVVEIARRDEPLLAEVIGFDDELAMLLPLGTAEGVGPDDAVTRHTNDFSIRVSDALLGRVLDGLGRPIDAKGPIDGETWAVRRSPPPPLSRARISKPLAVGVRAIDGLLTIGEGQRVGIFSGSGVGKSTLLGQIARHAEADVYVLALVGERGRELREFVEDVLGEEGLARGVVVCATSDAPSLVRLESAHVATAIAEWFRDRGKRVLLLMDSLTRFMRAAREVGLAAGEPPARRGFPPSAFAALPTLLERTGNGERGSITALYTILVEGGDLDEPVADEARGILDGHIVLTRELASRGRYPAIDPVASISRSMDAIVPEAHRAAARRVREILALYEDKRDLVLLGAYRAGSDARLDDALRRIDAIESFLRQSPGLSTPFAAAVRTLGEVVA